MKEFNNEHLGKFLDIENDMESTEIEIMDDEESKEIVRGDEILDDYALRRKTLHNLVDTGQEALTHMMLVAKESDHPRAFETTSDMVADLTKLQIEMNKIESEKGGSSKVVNNNSVFVGNTNELLEMLKGKNRE